MTEFQTPASPIKSCLVCGHLRPLAVWDEASRAGVCVRCRDARRVIVGGATDVTPKTHAEFMAAVDRVMAHYLGDDAPTYGDARFILDYAISLVPASAWSNSDV